jgi:two-component system response regulator AtoC
MSNAEHELHAADIEQLERRIMDMALERTAARSGAIFLWDTKAKGLALDFHVVDGLVVNLPQMILRRRKDGRPNGIALETFDRAAPYLCADTSADPSYAPYFLDVGSIAAVPITYQDRAIGVLSVSAKEKHAFAQHHLDELAALAASAAKFLRRAQMSRASRSRGETPFVIKGLSPEWLEVERRIEQVAPTRASVLVHGESGTGKELVARAIHFNSRRASAPFVVVNCAAIPETLIESTLFGHVRGAFTGASGDKLGEMQKAEGGTLFLDEIGELPLSVQAKLLRAIEYGEAQPVGSSETGKKVDVRFVCATHRDLAAMVKAARFRDDLYYRLGVFTIELPPLRSYKDNIDVLAHVFLKQAAQRHDKRVLRISESALALLRAYDYPGNVRELKNAIEHAVILARGDVIGADELPRTLNDGPRPARAAKVESELPTIRELREQALAPIERRYLEQLLARHGGNLTSAAEHAGIDRVTFYRLLKKRGVAERSAPKAARRARRS